MGADIHQVFSQLADAISDVVDGLAPDTPEVQEILHQFHYDETLE